MNVIILNLPNLFIILINFWINLVYRRIGRIVNYKKIYINLLNKSFKNNVLICLYVHCYFFRETEIEFKILI